MASQSTLDMLIPLNDPLPDVNEVYDMLDNESNALLASIISDLVSDIGTGADRFVDITNECFSMNSDANGQQASDIFPSETQQSQDGFSSETTSSNIDSASSPTTTVCFYDDVNNVPVIPQSRVTCCPICGNEAGKHSYYGAQVCNSCRAFFRRTVQSKSHPRFVCKRDQNCSINSRSWKSCQFCRFQKCLRSGMKIAWVLTESERKERARLRAASKRKRDNQLLTTCSPCIRVPSDCFTLEDRVHLRGLISTTYDFLYLEMCKYYTCHQRAFEEILSVMFHGRIMSQSTQRSIEDFIMYSVKNFYRGMSDMINLSERDQTVLVTKNYPLMMEFLSSLYIENAAEMQKHTTMFANKIKELPLQCAEFATQFRQLECRFHEARNSVHAKPILYEQIHPENWVDNKAAEHRYRELCFKIRDWPLDSADTVVDDIQMMLLALTMLFSTDFVDLDNPSKAAEVQTKYASMLYRYLKSKHKDSGAASKFCQAMMIGSMSREMREIKEKHWNV